VVLVDGRRREDGWRRRSDRWGPPASEPKKIKILTDWLNGQKIIKQ
jgi:hypothetical protein